MKNLYATYLNRSDLMELEAHLVQAIRGIIPFINHSLYFPTLENTPTEPQWISKERTLLVPLTHKGEKFGVFMARGAKAKEVRRVLPTLPALAELCLEHLLCIKQSRTDELTGLARMSRLLLRMEHYADMMRTPLMAGTEYQNYSNKACMALLIIRCPQLHSLTHEYGYTFAHEVLFEWAKAIQKDLPHEVLAARSDENECAILLPAATGNSCTKLAEEILNNIKNIKLTHKPSGRVIRLNCVAGFALFPQDMDNKRMALPMSEQAHYLLQKARLAAEIAFERSAFFTAEHEFHIPCMPYTNITSQGGIIREVLPLGQLLTNLGRKMGAVEGQCFSVWGQQGARKGEIVLVEVKSTYSIAEAILHDPAWTWEKGDCLRIYNTKIQQHNQLKKQDNIKNNSTGTNSLLLSHTDFLQKLVREQELKASFALALVRLSPQNNSIFCEEQENAMQGLIDLCSLKHKNSKNKDNAPQLQGKYGETGLVFFHPKATADSLYDFYIELAKDAEKQNMNVAVGLASYPYLQCSKGDILDYCHKALELALLLPKPQVGVMGSLALNISADQHYSRGNTFEAVEEYKLALLADPKNAMAWNSLGVCMAALNRLSEARQYFKEALKLWKKAPPTEQSKNEFTSTLYNLGTVCQNLKEFRSAARYFRQCIQSNNEHYFAHIRLGQLAEISSKYRQARQFFSIAANFEDVNKHYGGIARRHLARVALRQRKDAEARELLHEALLRNPQDAIAMSILAKLYLDSGEDPSMSEMLARKSVGLRPDYAPAWIILAESLRAMGRAEDALLVEQNTNQTS